MASDHKRQMSVEAELRRIIGRHGIKTAEIEGVHHVGFCSVRQVGTHGGAYVPAGAAAVAIPLPALVRDILEALS